MGEQREREPRDSSKDADLQAEITRLTFKNFAATAVVSAIGTVGAMSLLANHFHDAWLWHIAVLMTIVCSVRIALPIAFERRRDPHLTHAGARRWQAAHATGTAFTCCNISASTLHNFSHHEYTAQFICTLGIFILCAGMSASFGLKPWIAQLCGLTALGTLGFSVYRAYDPWLALIGCAMIGLFAIVYCKLVVEKYKMVVEQLLLKRQMSQLAEHDTLTGLANRRQFESQLAHICGQPGLFAVLFLDLDGFKKVNDTHGHATGDALLQQVAMRLNDTVRSHDLVARLGGDEFAILHQPLATAQSTEVLARHILDIVSTPYQIDGLSIRIGTSIGIQLSGPGRNDPNLLLSQADSALYQVKQSGKGNFRFVTSTEAVVITGVAAPIPDAAQSGSRAGQDRCNGLGKLLVGVRQ